jgi:hypothetical protein
MKEIQIIILVRENGGDTYEASVKTSGNFVEFRNTIPEIVNSLLKTFIDAIRKKELKQTIHEVDK